jgi:GntP family gluconate:H+ symporter
MGSLQIALIGFIVSLIFILISIIKFKAHPFLALIIGALVMGIVSGLPLPLIASELATGFGNTMGGVGIIIVFGIIFGQLLQKSGCAEQIASMLLKAAGAKNVPLAMNLTGYIVSIPVFFDAAFVILVNLIKNISRKGKVPFITLVTALAVGLITTHSMTIPTPGPLAVVANMGTNIPSFIAYSMIVSLFASLVGGVVYGKWLGKRPQYRSDFALAFEEEFEEIEKEETKKSERVLPSGSTGILLIALPILMILLGTVLGQFLEEGTFARDLVSFVGDRNIALIVGTVVAYFVLKKYLSESFSDIIGGAASVAGAILIITGAGGAFGRIINQTAIGTELGGILEGVAGATGVGLIFILLGFFISQVLRCAQGSTTVALITTSAIMGPIVAGIPGVSIVLVSIAICAGGIGLSLPNDSGFWVVNRLSKFTMQDTFRSWTVGGTITGATALIILVILGLFQNVLPGLL